MVSIIDELAKATRDAMDIKATFLFNNQDNNEPIDINTPIFKAIIYLTQ